MDDQSYLRYKEIRNFTWQLLIDNNIKTLPVDVFAVANNANITILFGPQAQELLLDCGLLEMASKQYAISVFTDKWYVCCQQKAENSLSLRFFIAHELGHIFLKHPMKEHKVGYFTAYCTEKNDDEYCALAIEQEANDFAVRLLAPACILSEMDIASGKDLVELCGLTEEQAKTRLERLKKLALKKHFFTHQLEKQLHEQFVNKG